MHKGYENLVKTGRKPESFSYHWVRVYCRKVQCHSCPHGPYLYARYRDGKNVKAIYIGKIVPPELESLVSTP